MATVNVFFLSELNSANIIGRVFFQRLFLVAESCLAVCFTPFLSTAIIWTTFISHVSVATHLKCDYFIADFEEEEITI